MKCLSLWQPHATLIAIRAKQIETHSWATNYRGPLAIHAGKLWNWGMLSLCLNGEIGKTLLPLFPPVLTTRGRSAPKPFPLGAIVAVVDLRDCLRVERIEQLTERERAFGDYRPGRFGWLLENARPLKSPLPWKGARGLFDVADDQVLPLLQEATA